MYFKSPLNRNNIIIILILLPIYRNRAVWVDWLWDTELSEVSYVWRHCVWAFFVLEEGRRLRLLLTWRIFLCKAVIRRRAPPQLSPRKTRYHWRIHYRENDWLGIQENGRRPRRCYEGEGVRNQKRFVGWWGWHHIANYDDRLRGLCWCLLNNNPASDGLTDRSEITLYSSTYCNV